MVSMNEIKPINVGKMLDINTYSKVGDKLTVGTTKAYIVIV